jgi:hypothetical protein
MLLFHSSHHHAEMAGFDYHAHSLWLNDFLDGLGKLRGQPAPSSGRDDGAMISD